MKIESIVFILLAFLVVSCDNSGNIADTTIHVYKMKQDYSSYVLIALSPDKSAITSAPGQCESPVKLSDNYYLGNSMGVNTAYLSITIEEYNTYDPIPGIDSLYNYIMETDPYLEYYISEDAGLRNEGEIDTAFINNLILENNLENYFTRIK